MSATRTCVDDLLLPRLLGRTFMIDLAACLQKVQIDRKACLRRRILERLPVGIEVEKDPARAFDIQAFEA
jgi:hypothetical protein